jgi:hypothetical protein
MERVRLEVDRVDGDAEDFALAEPAATAWKAAENLVVGLSGRWPGGPLRYAVAGVRCQVVLVRVSPRLISRRRLRAATRWWSQM